MADNSLISEVELLDGTVVDIAAKRWDGSRNVELTGDVTGSKSNWNGSDDVSFSTTIGAGKVTAEKIADGAVENAKLGASSVTLDKIDGTVKCADISVTAQGDRLATANAVAQYVDNAIQGTGHYRGKLTVAQINALTSKHGGDRVIVTGDPGYVTDSDVSGGLYVRDGEDLIYYVSPDGATHHWDSMDGEFALKQHTHAISDVVGLSDALDGKQATLPTTGTPSATYAINVSGSASHSTTSQYMVSDGLSVAHRFGMSNDVYNGVHKFQYLNGTNVLLKDVFSVDSNSPFTATFYGNITGNAATATSATTATKLSNVTNSPNNKNLASADTDGNVYVVSWTNTCTDSTNGNLFMLGGNSRTTKLRWLADDYSTASGSTTTNHYGHLIWNPTSRYDITFPNASGTVALTNGTIANANKLVAVQKTSGSFNDFNEVGRYYDLNGSFNYSPMGSGEAVAGFWGNMLVTQRNGNNAITQMAWNSTNVWVRNKTASGWSDWSKLTNTSDTIATATNANNIEVTQHTGATSGGLFPVMVDGFGNSAPYANNFGLAYFQTASTTTADGYAMLSLGNAIADGETNARRGILRIYGKASARAEVVFEGVANYTHTLPNATGTIALTSDLATRLEDSDIEDAWNNA